jgi:tetratricopeptide (TPR) repeat protein
MSEFAHGLLLQDQGRLEEAEACFYSVLAQEPENDYCYFRLSLCQMTQEGKKQRALESVEAAIRLQPLDSTYHAIRAVILAALRRGTQALTAAEEAISLAPEDALARAAKANALSSMERWAESEQWCLLALECDPDHSMAANLLAHVLRMQGKSVENADAVAALLAADPEDSMAHVNAGWSALQRGDRKQAEVHFREALRLDPESDVARTGLIESFRARSVFYRAYLAYTFFLQRFTAGKQWAIMIGLYAIYQIARANLKLIDPRLSVGFVFLWLALVFWIWLAPGVGNFLILMDRSARLALDRQGAWLGLAVGGGLTLGAVLLAGGWYLGIIPLLLAGVGILVSTVPASLTFGNESRTGRWVFGGITGLAYAASIFLPLLEAFRLDAKTLHPLTALIGSVVLLAAMLCTWLGNVRALRQGDEG